MFNNPACTSAQTVVDVLYTWTGCCGGLACATSTEWPFDAYCSPTGV